MSKIRYMKIIHLSLFGILLLVMFTHINACELIVNGNDLYCSETDANDGLFLGAYLYQAESVVCVYTEADGNNDDCHEGGHFIPKSQENWNQAAHGVQCGFRLPLIDSRACQFDNSTTLGTNR